jgi:predicted nucleotidyltransferase component of viral defense system
MNEAVTRMLARYEARRLEDYVRALREILQEIVLLGLWRSKFFEHAAFYGGTALRILHGIDRFSDDLDFSLIRPSSRFDLSRYSTALQTEIRSFGFEVRVVTKEKEARSAIQSAFLKADTLKQLVVVEAGREMIRELPRGQVLKIKIEVDTDPPPGFETETRFLLHPIPFSVRTYVLPDLFAGKMHALLCRRWKSRVKGRDWYDLVWYTANHPRLHLLHLEQRMRQSGDLEKDESLTQDRFHKLLDRAIAQLDVGQAKKEVEPFIKDVDTLSIWSREFFRDIAKRIQLV